MKKKFNEIVRTLSNSLIAGVCGALAEYFNINVKIVRIAYLVLTLISALFPCIFIYLLLMLIIPRKEGEKRNPQQYRYRAHKPHLHRLKY